VNAPGSQRAEDVSRQELVQQLRALETPELLALCLRGPGRVDRLRLYLSILRGRAGTRAQLAASLVCFDLARRGDELAQREFLTLVPALEVLARDGQLVNELLAGDADLKRAWADCRAALAQGDQRELEPPSAPVDVDLVGELDLLSDDDVEFDIDLEQADALRGEQASHEFGLILAKQLGQDSEQGLFGAVGFETASSRDLDRLEAFLNQAVSYGDLVGTARGMASLGQLFLATNLRMKTLFGKRNARRATALRLGLSRLPADSEALEQAAAVFELEGGNALVAFEKVLELLLDYLAFCHQQRKDPRGNAAVEAYVEAERSVAPVLLTGNNRRRRG
jgi:hypothetical protein